MDAKSKGSKREGILVAELVDVIAFILSKYPNKSDLSNARVTKMVYLADWRNAILFLRQITGIHWYFDNYGPFVWDIKQTAEANKSLFSSKEITNPYGNPKLLLELVQKNYIPRIHDDERKSLDHVINQTKDLSWSEFIRLVYSTYPIISSERYSYLDLCAKAKEYVEISPRI